MRHKEYVFIVIPAIWVDCLYKKVHLNINMGNPQKPPKLQASGIFVHVCIMTWYYREHMEMLYFAIDHSRHLRSYLCIFLNGDINTTRLFMTYITVPKT